jgi:hypothetical protein
MPLPKSERQTVINYVLKDLTPPLRKGERPIDWFENAFEFIATKGLRQQLAQAYYQARFFEKLREAMGLSGGFNHGLLKTQIVLYASIYEALIDDTIQFAAANAKIEKWLVTTEFVEIPQAVSKNTRITYTDGGGATQMVLCKKKQTRRDLKRTRFGDKVEIAIDVGFVPSAQKDFLTKLYDSRNTVHLLAAASKSFTPDDQQSSAAFSFLLAFIESVKKWRLKQLNK